MKQDLVAVLVAGCLAVGLGVSNGAAQSVADTVEAHCAAAKAAAGVEYVALFVRFADVCGPDVIKSLSSGPAPAPQRGQAARGTAPAAANPAPRQNPPREEWYREPVKVFDNFYFVGTKVHSSWAVTTSDGIIVIDALYDYAVRDAVVGGLRKLGLNPANIKYVVISHGHADHHGGAKFLQDEFSARVVMAAADWELVERNTGTPGPKRDIVATDGQKLTLGDTTLTLYQTPGHTAGTISVLVPVKDGGRPHLMATWGGTGFSATGPAEALKTYINSAARYRDIVTKAGAEGILSNHVEYDGTPTKLPAVEKRKPGSPHPYVVGTDSVRRYLTLAEEIARAALATPAASTRR